MNQDVFFAIVGSLALLGCYSPRDIDIDVSAVERRIVLPDGSYKMDQYSRNYSTFRVDREEDLPFTTISNEAAIPYGRVLTLGVLYVPSDIHPGQFGAHVVERSQMPYIVHGGCSVINVVLDPSTAANAAVWCNADPNVAPPPPP